MEVAVFSTKPYDEVFFREVNEKGFGQALDFFEPRLSEQTAPIAAGFPGVCAFVNDDLSRAVLERLARGGTRLIALRCSGFNNVDLTAIDELGLTVARVPAYSPHAVAEHTVGLILGLNRKIYRSYNRVRELNFALNGLLGFDLHGRTVGVVGTGKIGSIFARIMLGFGCEVVAFDVNVNEDLAERGVEYVALEELFRRSNIISLHCPLIPQTHHMIDQAAVEQMTEGVMLINTSRGGLIDSQCLIPNLKSGKIGYLGLDVYEEEADLFFEDLSTRVVQDDLFARLLTFPNVLITGHQAFFTDTALRRIAETTLNNVREFERTGGCRNVVTPQRHHAGKGRVEEGP